MKGTKVQTLGAGYAIATEHLVGSEDTSSHYVSVEELNYCIATATKKKLWLTL